MKRSAWTKGVLAMALAGMAVAMVPQSAEAGGRRHHRSHYGRSYHGGHSYHRGHSYYGGRHYSRPYYHHYSSYYAPRYYAPAYYPAYPAYYSAPYYSDCYRPRGFSIGFGYY